MSWPLDVSTGAWNGCIAVRPARSGPRLHDLAPTLADFRAEVVCGLGRSPKSLPCKFLYDRRGSQLFERICQLPEYYVTRTELAILRQHAREIAAELGGGCLLVEYGSGSSVKTRLLLDHMRDVAAYVPLDISREHLMEAARRIDEAYPELNVVPVCADYTAPFTLPELPHGGRTIVYFPGSTIGNFDRREVADLLRVTASLCGREGGLVIGVDLKKRPDVLHAAYNDAAGVTAAFNINLLQRINRELDGTFDVNRFAHHAFYSPRRGRIEMHLISQSSHSVRAAGEQFRFREGETIFTESSHKYTLDEFRRLAAAGGWEVRRVWMDERRLFSVQYLTPSL